MIADEPAAAGDELAPGDDVSDERGMGVKFAGLDVDQLMALNEYFGSLTSTMDHDEA